MLKFICHLYFVLRCTKIHRVDPFPWDEFSFSVSLVILSRNVLKTGICHANDKVHEVRNKSKVWFLIPKSMLFTKIMDQHALFYNIKVLTELHVIKQQFIRTNKRWKYTIIIKYTIIKVKKCLIHYIVTILLGNSIYFILTQISKESVPMIYLSMECLYEVSTKLSLEDSLRDPTYSHSITSELDPNLINHQ